LGEHGHLQGDLVLADTARTLREGTRPEDVVGRWGGEEFLVILSGGESQDVLAAAEKIRERIAQADSPLGRPVTVSIGGAMWRPGMAINDVLGAADEALYEAKRGGRNRSVVSVETVNATRVAPA
jgi:diguanylate cyclase (GGDEF)-like protein